MAKKKNPRPVDTSGQRADYPRHSVLASLRIPQAVIEQHAGGREACTDEQAAKFSGASLHGENRMQISSAIKYGFFERPSAGHVRPTDLARRVVRPQGASDRIDGLRTAVLQAPQLGEVYRQYRGEYLPDAEFFDNALTDTFHIPKDKLSEFKEVFLRSLREAELLEERDGRMRLVDISQAPAFRDQAGQALKKLEETVQVEENTSCFVVMPFALPHGGYYEVVYEPAIRKAGLKPVRADSDIFGTGKVIDQIWDGINAAKVLVAELTTRNPNVFYELGLAHALQKPVVLVAGNEQDVPFDIRHFRVILYDTSDPKWGDKLIDKVAEHILSAIKNPAEAVFKVTAQR